MADTARDEKVHAVRLGRLLRLVAMERAAQDELWGEQNHPNGTGPDVGASSLYDPYAMRAAEARATCQRHAADGTVTWLDILREEVFEAFAEDDPAKLYHELVQVAAVAVNWAEALERRTGVSHG